MLIKAFIVMTWKASFAIMQSITVDDSISSNIESSSSSLNSVSDPDIVQNLQTNAADISTETNDAMWTFDLFNYSNMCSLYDHTPQLMNSLSDHMKLLYHYLLARVIALLTLIPSISKTNTESENDAFLSWFTWPALTYHLYTAQTLLFRTETLAIVCILFILALFFNFLMHNRQRNHLPEGEITESPICSPLLGATNDSTTKSNLFTGKLIRYLNITILFANLFAIVGAVFRHIRTSETVVLEDSFGHAGVHSMQGRRPNMEDTFTLKNNIYKDLGIDYYAVYDGHGGQNAALQAEKEIFDGIVKRIKDHLNGSNKENCNIETVTKVPNAECSITANTANNNSFVSSAINPKTCPARSNRFDTITTETMKDIINDVVTKIDDRLVEQFRKNRDISGSTALIAIRLVHSNTLLVANVGDSRAIMCDWKGATIPLSFDHKPYQLKEYRRIVNAGGFIMLRGVYRVNGILAVSRALGDYPLKEDRLVIPNPDILSFDLNELKPRFMIVASDGFWDTFTNENAVRFVHNELIRYGVNYTSENQSSLALNIARKLANEAYTRESSDNITVIVVLFDSAHSKSYEL